MNVMRLTEDSSQHGGWMVFRVECHNVVNHIVLSLQILGMIFALVLICKIGSEGTYA